MDLLFLWMIGMVVCRLGVILLSLDIGGFFLCMSCSGFWCMCWWVCCVLRG